MSASGAHYEAERAEHLRNADEELEGGVGGDIGMLDGVPQRCPGSGYYTQAEVDRIAGKERKLEVDPDRFLRELDDKRVEVGMGLLLPVLNKEGAQTGEVKAPWEPDNYALCDAVLEARRAALDALRRFTQNEARLTNGLELLDLLAAEARLEAAERALKEAE